MAAVTKELVLQTIETYRAENAGRLPSVRQLYSRTGGNWNRVAGWLAACHPIDDQADDVPSVPPAAVDIAATLIRWDSLTARYKTLSDERLPAAEEQHAALMGEIAALQAKRDGLRASIAQAESKRQALEAELSGLRADVRQLLLSDIRPASNMELQNDLVPK